MTSDKAAILKCQINRYEMVLDPILGFYHVFYTVTDDKVTTPATTHQIGQHTSLLQVPLNHLVGDWTLDFGDRSMRLSKSTILPCNLFIWPDIPPLNVAGLVALSFQVIGHKKRPGRRV
ncbi:hypothetical protein AKJ29_09905 [Aliiroseovarius crassostreae]|uniref:Uncharacterized protein n=1 Tax=Aliiroseovarius crassostreae TaxID=154981 RepID=A0A0P7J4C4_9RHOB|nr:hypothetical protein AKJ29_09905 [Aliiroseovarius crassostreae]